MAIIKFDDALTKLIKSMGFENLKIVKDERHRQSTDGPLYFAAAVDGRMEWTFVINWGDIKAHQNGPKGKLFFERSVAMIAVLHDELYEDLVLDASLPDFTSAPPVDQIGFEAYVDENWELISYEPAEKNTKAFRTIEAIILT